MSSDDLTSTTPGTAFWQRIFRPVDIASLVFFRVAFGLIMLVEVIRYLAKGWIQAYYGPRPLHFKFYGFEAVEPWAGVGMTVHFWIMGALALAVAAGFCYRLSATLFFLAFSYVFLLEHANYLNHFYLICVVSLLLVFLPAHRAFSIDAWLRPGIRSQTVPAWAPGLIAGQMGVVYLYAGVAKLNPDWLHGEPIRMWLGARQGTPTVGPLLTQEWVVYLIAYGGLLLDLLAMPLLLWKRTRVPFAVVAAGFHLCNFGLFSIGVFPWFAIAATLMFLSPDWPRRVLRLMRFPVKPADCRAAEGPGPRSQQRNAVLGLISLFAAWQLLLPLRHLLYPGDVNWTEEGHNFSWRMKLRSKSGTALFTVSDPRTGAFREVDPKSFLTARQYSKMATKPDLIHQFAQFLAARERAAGREGVEVRVKALCRLNGRPPQLLIDPAVDLAAEPRSLRHKPWILPLETPLIRSQGGSPGARSDD